MLPAFAEFERAPRLPSAGAVYLAQVLEAIAPNLEIVGVARRPGVLSKVAVVDPAPAADAVAHARAALDGEHIEIVTWDPEPRRYIANALGLAEEPPTVLRPVLGHAQVLVGEIDLRGMNGWRGINRLLASSLTGWRIRLLPIAESAAWRSLRDAQAANRAVPATVLGPSARGTRVEVHGLYATLPRQQTLESGEEVRVRVARMNADEGTIRVARARGRGGQLALTI
jgi:transcription antitermination factor NusA-like protein